MADKVNLIIDQGSTYTVDFLVYHSNDSIVDLSGFTSEGSIRKHYTSNNEVILNTTVFANGTIRASLTSNQSSLLTEGRYVYDIKMTDSNDVTTRIVEGVITVTPQVAR